MIAWRIETPEGTGLYAGRNYNKGIAGRWNNTLFNSNLMCVPSPSEDFGTFVFDKYAYGRSRFAFTCPHTIVRYLGDSEVSRKRAIAALIKCGFVITLIETKPLLASDTQVVYDPLYCRELRRFNPKKLFAYVN